MKIVSQFLKFGLVGLSNTIIAFIVYYSLLYSGAYYLLANLIAFLISVLNAYYWQNRYVFDRGTRSHFYALFRVYISYGFSLLLSTSLMFLLVDIIGVSEYIVPPLNLLVTVPLNFVVNKFWAYKR